MTDAATSPDRTGTARPGRLRPRAGRPACIGQLPRAPGVYRFRDARGRVLYVGRAASLRSRVSSYWGDLGDRGHLSPMVQRIARVEAVACDSEHEAAWLERNLLERQLPPWNRSRGGQEVPVYIRLDERPCAPGLKVVHAIRPSASARHFGPYLGGLRARLAVSALHRVLPLELAADGLTGSALGMAQALRVAPADRTALAGALTAVLDREPAAVASLRAEIVRRRDLAAQRLAFEVAARLQSELEAIGWIVAEQKAALAEAADYDIRGWADGMLICFGVRGARLCSWTQRACAELSAHPQVAATRRRGPGSLLATPSSPRGWPGHQPSGSWYKKGMAAAEPPGPLVGSGRSADVYALGPGRVLRRFRTPYNAQAEADIMIHLAKAGFPVPAVHDADGPDLVMERLDGRDMLADLSSRPWLARRHGRTLAMLHNRLHQVRAPAGLRTAFGPGDRVLHLDLHPGNVMLTSRGPVVIDWTNASAGAPGADVAMAYLIMASSDTDLLPWWLRPAVRALRAALLGQFRAAAHDNPAPHIARVARGRLTDRNVRPAEAGRLLRMAEQAERAAQAERP